MRKQGSDVREIPELSRTFGARPLTTQVLAFSWIPLEQAISVKMKDPAKDLQNVQRSNHGTFNGLL